MESVEKYIGGPSKRLLRSIWMDLYKENKQKKLPGPISLQ